MSASDQEKLADIRSKIDALDRQILSAIEDRAALASAVVAAKSGQHIFRPGREADLIRGLVAASSLSPQMIEVIWRQMIANNINNQQRLKIAMGDDAEMQSTAAFCFGVAIDQVIGSNAADVIDAVAKGDADLGVLPYGQTNPNWLDDLSRQNGQVFIIGITPFIKGQEIAGTVLKDAVIVARQLPDASQADVTLCVENGTITEHDGYHADADGLVGIIQKRSLSAG